jgi:hypothetical protein
MIMISAIDSASSNTITQSQSAGIGPRRQDMAALSDALKSGDLDAAQTAYASLTGNTAKVSADSPLGKIGAALEAGDIGAAQKVAQAAKGHGAHHHAHATAPAAAAAPSASPSGTGAIINTTA